MASCSTCFFKAELGSLLAERKAKHHGCLRGIGSSLLKLKPHMLTHPMAFPLSELALVSLRPNSDLK